MKLYNFDSPKTWEELVKLKDKIGNTVPEVARFPDDLAFYTLYTKLVPREIRLEIINQLIGDNKIKLLKNTFPYLKLCQHINGVEHYCLWSRIGKLPKEVIESELEKEFLGEDYFWFENSPNTKSIPEIWHCHIFVKRN